MMDTDIVKVSQPLWQRLTAAAVMFLVVGTVYTVAYGFWVGISGWADTKPSDADTAERFYLINIWAVILVISLVTPTIITLLNTRWLWKWVAWILGILLAFLGWVAWFGVIEFTSK